MSLLSAYCVRITAYVIRSKTMARQPRPTIPAAVEAAWGRRERPVKGPRPALTLALVVDGAIRVADREGLGAVSMGRVAAELGVATMSLYRYVAAKDELLALMVDHAAGEPPEVSGKAWRPALSAWAWTLHQRLRERPWALRVPISGPPVMPNQTAWLEAGLRTLAGTRVAEAEKASVVLLVSGYARNSATLAADLEASFLAEAAARDDAMAGYAGLLRQLTSPEQSPSLHAV